MRRAQAVARSTGQNIERSMSQMRVRTVQAFGSVRVAAAGLGLAMGAGVFVAQARSAFEFASSITEASRAIGVTVEQYQILNRAALENGSSTEGMARAVGILNRTLGQARAGVPAAVEAFRALRIDPEQFTKAGDVIPRVMEAIRGLRTQSEQAAAAQRLLGRGAAELIPFLIQGAAGYDRAAEAARRHGLMTAEQAERADEAKDAIDGLALTIRTNLGIAIAENSSAIAGWIAQFEALGRSVGGVIGWLESLRTALNVGQATGNSWLWQAVAVMNPGLAPQADLQRAGNNRTIEGLRPAPPGAGAGASFLRAIRANRAGPGTGDVDLDLSPAGSRSSGRNAAAEAARRRHEVETELNRAKIEELRSQQETTQSAATRADLNLQISFLEQLQGEMDRRLAVLLRDRTQAEADAVADIEVRAFHNRRQAIEAEEQDRLAVEQRDITAGALEDEITLASSFADLADTARDRLQAQLHLLDLAQQQERMELEGIRASKDATDAQKAVAQARLDILDTLYQARRQGAMNANRGPMGDFLAELPTTAARANEALERVAADGLSSITDGLVNAIMLTKSWGSVVRNVVGQVIADFLRLQVQRSVTGPLANLVSNLFSNLGGSNVGTSSGGWMAQLANLGGTFAARAAGGPVLPGRTYLIGEKGPELLRMGGASGMVVANDQIGGGGEVHVHQTFRFEGVAVTQAEFAHGLAATKSATIQAVREARRRSA